MFRLNIDAGRFTRVHGVREALARPSINYIIFNYLRSRTSQSFVAAFVNQSKRRAINFADCEALLRICRTASHGNIRVREDKERLAARQRPLPNGGAAQR